MPTDDRDKVGLMLVEGQHFALNTASVSLLGIDPNHPDRRIIELRDEVSRAQPKDLP